MDTASFLIGVIIMMLAASYDAYWLVVGVALVLMLTMRSLSAIVLLLISIGIIVFFRGNIQEYAPYILFGLIILSLLLDAGKKQEAYPQDMGGLGGLEGMFGPGQQY